MQENDLPHRPTLRYNGSTTLASMKDRSKNDHKEGIKAAIKQHEDNNEEGALKMYKELIAKGCTDTTIYMNAGAIQRKRKEYDDAVGYIEKDYIITLKTKEYGVITQMYFKTKKKAS